MMCYDVHFCKEGMEADPKSGKIAEEEWYGGVSKCD
jgi:hypothetical protein